MDAGSYAVIVSLLSGSVRALDSRRFELSLAMDL